MSHRTVTLLCVLAGMMFASSGAATAQTIIFKSAAAKEAQREYEETLAKAREEYSKKLQLALVAAVTQQETEETNRIKEVMENVKLQKTSNDADPLVRARNQLINTSWTWNRPKNPNFFTLRPKGLVAKRKGASGTWEMIEPRVALLTFEPYLFVLSFDKSLRSYRVLKAYQPVKTLYTVGKKR